MSLSSTLLPPTLLSSPRFLGWCQRRDLNPRPKAYESSALPLSYSGNPEKTDDFRFCACACAYFCKMTRDETQNDAETIDPALKHNPAFNRRNERVRGLWERNGVYYAQVKVRGWTGNVRLHAETVADAVAARQVVKTEIKSGKFLTPPELKQREEKEKAEKVSTEVSTRTLTNAVTKYQAERDTLGKQDPQKSASGRPGKLKNQPTACSKPPPPATTPRGVFTLTAGSLSEDLTGFLG